MTLAVHRWPSQLFCIISSFHELMQSRGVRRPSVCLSVNILQIASSTRQMAGSPPNLHTMVPRRSCIQSVLKVKVEVKRHSSHGETIYQTVCYTVYGLTFCLYNALTLWSTITLSFQYKYQAARSNAYILEWAILRHWRSSLRIPTLHVTRCCAQTRPLLPPPQQQCQIGELISPKLEYYHYKTASVRYRPAIRRGRRFQPFPAVTSYG